MDLDERFRELGIRIFPKGDQLNVYYKSRKRDKFTVILVLLGCLTIPFLPMLTTGISWGVAFIFLAFLLVLGIMGVTYYFMPILTVKNANVGTRKKFGWSKNWLTLPVNMTVLDSVQDFSSIDDSSSPKQVRVIALTIEEEKEERIIFLKQLPVQDDSQANRIKQLMKEFIQLLQSEKIPIE